MRGGAAIFLISMLAMASQAFAVQPNEMLSDPALEARARAISSELRCLVCQNQSIDDSDAPLAGDLRRLVRERLVAHDTDQQVLDYVVARYGQFVLLKPPFELTTLLLWATPVIVLLGGFALALNSASRRGTAPNAELSAEEKAKLATLMADDQDV